MHEDSLSDRQSQAAKLQAYLLFVSHSHGNRSSPPHGLVGKLGTAVGITWRHESLLTACEVETIQGGHSKLDDLRVHVCCCRLAAGSVPRITQRLLGPAAAWLARSAAMRRLLPVLARRLGVAAPKITR